MPRVRRIQTGESETYRSIRLASLRDAPHAFCATLENALSRSDEDWRSQADSAVAGSDAVIFLAFDEETPIGVTACYRDEQTPRTCELFQVWVAPEFRSQGIARSLLDSCLA